MPLVPDLRPLAEAFQSFVTFGDFEPLPAPYASKLVITGLFTSILGGGSEFYHTFFGLPIDTTQFFVTETATIIKNGESVDFAALVLKEVDFDPPTAPDQRWNWSAILAVAPFETREFTREIRERPGITTVPGATFNATFLTTRISTGTVRKAFTQGYFIDFE